MLDLGERNDLDHRACAHPTYIPHPAVRVVQGMACVQLGQAPAWPSVSDGSVRRGSGIKRDLPCMFTRHFRPVLVVLGSQSRLRLEERTRALTGPSPI
jgi:hypothetical protein